MIVIVSKDGICTALSVSATLDGLSETIANQPGGELRISYITPAGTQYGKAFYNVIEVKP